MTRDSPIGDPLGDVGWVEADVLADLVEGDASLVDEAPHKPDVDAEALSQGTHVDQWAGFIAQHLYC